MQDGGVGDMIPPGDTKNGAKASEMKCIEPVFLAAYVPVFLAIQQKSKHTMPKDFEYSAYVYIRVAKDGPEDHASP